MTVSKVNPAGLSLFMRHLAAVTKKYDDRDKARESLGNHLRKLKKGPLVKMLLISIIK